MALAAEWQMAKDNTLAEVGLVVCPSGARDVDAVEHACRDVGSNWLRNKCLATHLAPNAR